MTKDQKYKSEIPLYVNLETKNANNHVVLAKISMAKNITDNLTLIWIKLQNYLLLESCNNMRFFASFLILIHVIYLPISLGIIENFNQIIYESIVKNIIQ